jgi:hypothetical protein
MCISSKGGWPKGVVIKHASILRREALKKLLKNKKQALDSSKIDML